MEHPLRVLIVDDRQPDAELSARQIGLGGYPCTWRRVETETEFRNQLRTFAPDLILSDFSLPQYDGLSALRLAVREAPGTPFIFVSGTIGEKRARDALERGAADYIPKTDLKKLGPAVARALAESVPSLTEAGPLDVTVPTMIDVCPVPGHARRRATGRAPREVPAERIRRLGGALHMLSSMRAAATSIRTRTSLLEEACRIVYSTKQYERCAITLVSHNSGQDATAAAEMGAVSPGASTVSLPLVVGACEVGKLTVGVAAPAHISEQELLLLETMASQISFTLRGLLSEMDVRRAATPDILERSRESELEKRLRLAIKEEQFFLRYQPLIERVSGRVTAVEALLRWRDPERGTVLPATFVPILERTGLIVPVGEWVLAKAARDCGRWRRMGLPPIRVAVNVSPEELVRKDFAGSFLKSIREAGSDGGIDIEITESALFDNSASLRKTLEVLRASGVRAAIDDFGMGYSSLGRLTELPLDTLKIDRLFVSALCRKPQSQAVVSTIISLARAYGLQTIAEGVETMEQLEILNSLGCEHSQGYLHSPPVSAEELELLVAASSPAL